MPEPVLDAAVVAGLGRLGPDVVGQLAEMFLAEVPARSDAIRTAVAAGDRPALAFAAHTLAGSSASLGAAELARRCAALERDGTTGQLAAVEGELGRVCSALSALAPA